MWLWHVKMTTQNLSKLLLLLMLMMRNVSTTAWCRFGRWILVIKLIFCSDFEDKFSRFGQDFKADVQARFWSWSLVIILLLMLGCGYEVHFWSRFWFGLVKSFVEMVMFGWDFEGDTWSRFWRWNLIKICVWTCDTKLNPRVRCAFGNVLMFCHNLGRNVETPFKPFSILPTWNFCLFVEKPHN